ncbi:MAG: hypothetical protein IPP47_14925 [Bryobacterales bacterium]|nr:hypothetical protein [Bryobacterales bacterium]
MLMIRKAQMHTLGRERHKDFARRAGQHLCASFAECAALPPEQLRTFVSDGIAKAARYGIESEQEVCKFLNLLVVFGPEFDTELAWARKTLAAKDGASLRLNRLYARGIRVADGEDLA